MRWIRRTPPTLTYETGTGAYCDLTLSLRARYEDIKWLERVLLPGRVKCYLFNQGSWNMNARNYRWISWTLGLAMVGGLVAYPLTSRTALADEQKNVRIHKALEALRDARKDLDE